MRALYVSHLYAPAIGGAERYIADLSAEMVRRGHRVDLLTTRATDYLTWGSALPAAEEVDGVSVRRVRALRRRRYTWELLRYGLEHYRPTHRRWLEPLIFFGNGPVAPGFFTHVWQTAGRYDLVHINNLHYAHAWPAFVAARRRGLPVVITPHLHAEQPETWDVGYMRRILAESDLVLAVTSAEQTFLLAEGLSRRVVVAGNGLRLDRFPPLDTQDSRARFGLPPDAFVVLFLGRKTAYKGLDALLAAFRTLRAQRPNAYLLAIGPETPDSQRLWEISGDTPGLIVRGAVADEARLAALAACDVLALPSRAEAFGIVYLEAWAYRKPVIGAAIPAVASLIDDGEDGFLVNPDDPVQLHSRLLQLATHPAIAAALGARGYAKLTARYTVHTIGAIVEAAYARVLRHHRLAVEKRHVCSST